MDSAATSPAMHVDYSENQEQEEGGGSHESRRVVGKAMILDN